MIQFRFAAGLAVVVSAALFPTSGFAFFHTWRFTEFFSNHDGSVQFIELHTTFNNEHFSMGAQIVSNSTGKTFTFPTNLSSSQTANRSLLVATSGFGTLPGGVTPDFTLPSTAFFNPAGDTVRLVGIQNQTFTSVPTDGVMSRHYPANVLGTNSPTNFGGTTGSVNLPAPVTPTGDYNDNGIVDAADYVSWRNTLGMNVAQGSGADGDRSGMIDQGDYNFWRMRFGTVVSGSSAAVPEPATVAMVLGALAFIRPRRRTWS